MAKADNDGSSAASAFIRLAGSLEALCRCPTKLLGGGVSWSGRSNPLRWASRNGLVAIPAMDAVGGHLVLMAAKCGRSRPGARYADLRIADTRTIVSVAAVRVVWLEGQFPGDRRRGACQ